MAIEDDVLVIGGGLAGITAALAAAEFDLRVRLVAYKQSTLRQASGLIDVLGYPPAGADGADGSDGANASDEGATANASGGADGGGGAASSGPLTNPFSHLESLPTGHPYERVGPETVREALLFFDAVAGEAYAGGHTDRNALVATHGGTVKPTARYPASVAPGLTSDRRPTLLVGFDAQPGFDAPLAAAHLRATGVPFDVRGVTVSFPGGFRDDAKRTRYARALDEAEPIARTGQSTRAALAETIRPHLESEARVGLPAILGEHHPDVVRRDLAERLGVAVFEVPTGPPSVPGIRLERLLTEALTDAGVRVTTGVPVVEYEADHGVGGEIERIDRVFVDREGREVPYRADQYVLATGGLVGKGVRSSRAGVAEPIFDCHVAHPADRYAWFADDPFGEHAFARFGVSVAK